MTDKLKKDVLSFRLGKITQEELLSRLSFPIENKSIGLRHFIDEIIKSKVRKDVESGLPLLLLLEENNEFTDLLHILILEPWHSRYEEIIHELQARKDPSSVPVIKIAIQQKFEYLESYGTGTGQFICQCGYALSSIGTAEAIETMKYLAENAEDPIIRTEMNYQLDEKSSGYNLDESEEPKRWWDFLPE